MHSNGRHARAWACREHVRRDLTLLRERSEETRHAADVALAESRELIARCVEGRIIRANERAVSRRG